jgi:uncharacterized protein YjbI with pentapeptide repeats
MRVKNLTPFLVGYKVTSRRPPQPEMTVIVRGTFELAPGQPLRVPEGLYPLSQGSLRADVFREDDEERAGEVLYPGDFADMKLRAEVMLRGTCHPPGGQAVRDCPVRFSVGAWSKLLYVVGPRVWTEGIMGASAGDPRPFTEMPLSYENAFGGPGFAPNPVGKGIATADLPTVEHAGARVRSRADRPAPAGFGPVNPAWPARAGKLGKEYGRSYQEKRAPFYAEDFDWSYFSAAPPDQQLEGYLRGDEEVSFQNLHPRAPVFSTRLPGRRIRAFVKDARGRFREVQMVMDTLFADVDEGKLFLTWRGVDPVLETDLLDVQTLLAGDEPLGDEPLPEQHYRDALDAFEQDPIGIKRAVPEDLRGAWDTLRGKPSAASPEGRVASPDPISALLDEKLGGLAAPEQARIRKTIASFLALPLPPGVDQGAILRQALSALPANNGPAAPVITPGAMPRLPLGEPLRRLLGNLETLKRVAAARGTQLPQLEKIEALMSDPRLRALDPGIRAPGEPAPVPEEPGPGRDLSGQDLSRRDLRGADLRDANLKDAILTGAQLQGAQLGGATLERAILVDADLTDADLTGADLSLCNLSRARAPRAVFRRAKLDKLNAARAVFTGAVLAEARGEGATFAGADLGGVDARGVVLEQAVLDDASLEGARFDGARLTGCRLLKARARGARFERATITETSFADADLRAASFFAARGDRSIWLRARLDGADLRYAILPDAHFTEARAASTRFEGADLRRARFYRATLEGADLSRSNLFGADLCKSVLIRASFAGASLYDAKLLDASREGCDLEGANLRRSTLERT